MEITKNLTQVGDNPFTFYGEKGLLEGIVTIPNEIKSSYFALLGHPHSLQGGTMNNKVVTTMSRAFKELGIVSLRFNFRGVGASEGIYDQGIGESEDMLKLASLIKEEQKNAEFLFAGFSFGSYVAYRAAAQCENKLLITIAPPVHHYNYQEFDKCSTPWIIIQGTEDEVVPAHLVDDFAKNNHPPLTIFSVEQTGHFFHGKLIVLKDLLIDAINQEVLAQ